MFQNPFLRGMLGSQIAANQNTASHINTVGGLLSVQNAMRQAAVDEQMTPLKIEQLRMAVENAKMNQRLREEAMGGGAPSGPAPMAFGAGGMSIPGGGQANMNTGQVVGAPPQMGGGGIDPRIRSYLLSGDPGLKALGQAMLDLDKPIPITEGGALTRGGRIVVERPKLGENVLPVRDAQGNVIGVRPMPGATDVIAGVRGAEEGARAAFDLIPVPDGRGGTVLMPRSQAVQQLGGAPMPQAPRPMPQGVPQSPTPMQIPPQVQAGRDATAGAIRLQERGATGVAQDIAELEAALRDPKLGGTQRRILQTELNLLRGGAQPPAPQAGGGLGYTPPEAQRAAGKKREELGVAREADLPQAQLQVKTQNDDIDRLISIANETMNSPSLSRSVGLVGAFPSIPGQPAANVDSLVESLKAQVSGMKLQAMRNASKTGGAVGQVTEREWPRLESMIVALNKKMSPEMFREKLSELVVEMNKAKSAINAAFEQEYGSTPGFQRRRTDAPNDPLGLRR